jgi:hypothetical protein
VFDVNRELNAMSRELEFRLAKHHARAAVVKELADFAKVEAEVRAKEQVELVSAVEAEVLAALKGQEAAILKGCLSQLELLSARK